MAAESVGKDKVPKEFSDYTKMRYNDFKESRTFARYANSRAYNKIPAIVGYRDYKNIKRAATNAIVGSTTSDDVKVTSLSIHGLERIIGTDADYSHLKENGGAPIREGVHFSDVVDALHSSTVVPSKSDASVQEYFGHKARVTLNVKTGNIVQVNRLRGDK